MNEKLYEKLFNFDLKGIKNISISDNEIYNQFLLYIFFKYKKNILLVLPTLNEATEKYNDLKSYTDDVYLFPEDDFITKSAIAVSPELLYMRINLLNKIKDDKQKIVIVHLNSFIKKLPNIEKYQNQKIIFPKYTPLKDNLLTLFIFSVLLKQKIFWVRLCRIYGRNK